MDTFIKNFANLFKIKSLVTVILTVVFAVMALRGNIDNNFLTVYAVVISFYFGTQYAKNDTAIQLGG